MFNNTNSNNSRKRTASVLSRESELSQSPGSQTGVLDPGKGHHKGLETQMSVNSITQEEKTNSKTGHLLCAAGSETCVGYKLKKVNVSDIFNLTWSLDSSI